MYSPTFSREHVEKELSKLQKLNYNQFFWWRRWANRNKLLPKNAPLWDRILNGDFQYSHYRLQAMYCEYEMNDKFAKAIDPSHWVEMTRLDRQRRKRLLDDFDKDENEKLRTLQKEFLKEFKMDRDDYLREVEEFGGDLKEFYLHCEQRYGKQIRLKRRGRPPKIK